MEGWRREGVLLRGGSGGLTKNRRERGPLMGDFFFADASPPLPPPSQFSRTIQPPVARAATPCPLKKYPPPAIQGVVGPFRKCARRARNAVSPPVPLVLFGLCRYFFFSAVASPPPERRFRKVFPSPFFPLPHHLPIRAF